MKIINPNVELWQQEDKVAHVARCARVCYGKESGNDKILYNNLIKNGHWSMFRHESVYAMIPNHDRELKDLALYYANCPYINIHVFGGYTYVSTNRQFIMDNEDYPFIKLIQEYEVNKHDFIIIENHRQITLPMLRYTFHITTQRITSSDTNRSSPNNIAERSTRWINFEKRDGEIKICQFEHFDELPKNIQDRFIAKWKEEEELYKDIINAGFKVDIARHALSFPLATQCVYTYSVKEWRHFIDNRYYGVTGRPHDDYKLIAGMIRNELIKLGYEFR